MWTYYTIEPLGKSKLKCDTDMKRTLIEPRQRHGEINRPSSRSAPTPSRHMRHCFSSFSPELDPSDMNIKDEVWMGTDSKRQRWSMPPRWQARNQKRGKSYRLVPVVIVSRTRSLCPPRRSPSVV